jgi:PAS domain S-box-containing protein
VTSPTSCDTSRPPDNERAGVCQLLSQVVEDLDEPIVVVSPELEILIMNRVAREIAGVTSDSAHPGTCWNLLHGRHWPCRHGEIQCPVAEVQRTRQPVVLRHQHILRGELRSLEITSVPIWGGSGDLLAVVHTQRDVTDRVAIETFTTRARNEWEATADAVPDLLFLASPEGIVVRCNRAAREFLGLTYVEIIGHDLYSLLEATGMEGLDGLEEDHAELRRNHPRHVLELNRYPVPLLQTHLGHVFILRDVTRLRRLETIAASVDLTNNLGHVLSAVRHEIGNPANAIKTALTVLREGWATFSEEKRLTYLDRCRDDIARLQELLDQLRSFTVFESTTPEPTDPAALLSRISTLVQPDLDLRGIRIGLSISADSPCRILADPQAFRQVVLGIVANSIEALEGCTDPRVVLTCRVDELEVHLTIDDNGKGIPEEELDLVFLPLFTTKERGTGLGLYIARTIVTRMGGTIEVSSLPGKGTVFEIILPRLLPEGNPDSPRLV